MKKIIFIFILVLVALSVNLIGYSASFDAFTEIQDSGSLGFNLTLKFPTTFDLFNLEFWFSYGILNNLDLQVDLSAISFSSVDGVKWEGAYLLPRYDLGQLSILKYNILGVGLGYSGGFSLDVQYHTKVEIWSDIISLEINLIGDIIPNLGLRGIFAPVFMLLDWLALYVEVNPLFIPAFGVEVRPGVDIDFGNYGELNISYSTSQEIGIFYYIKIF